MALRSGDIKPKELATAAGRGVRYLPAPVLSLLTGLLVAALIIALIAAAYVAVHRAQPNLRLDRTHIGPLAFSEQFDHGLSLYNEYTQSGRWRTQYGYGGVDSRASRTHGELQCYVDPAFASLGLQPFAIRPNPKPGPTQPSAPNGDVLDIRMDTASDQARRACYDSPYVSGMISSQYAFSMNDGYWEIRAKMPHGAGGVWPAIWLLPADGQWPPEIDIVEMAQGVLYCTLHSRVDGVHVTNGRGFPELGDLSERFHSFGLLKTGAELVWYVDDQEVKRVATTPELNRPFYLIINLAMGDNSWVGRPNPASTPATLEVASIQAYRLR